MQQTSDRPLLVDYLGVVPADLLPLLERPGTQAVFLIPTPALRRAALTARYTDPARARANRVVEDPSRVLEARLRRDALWDAEVVAQAERHRLPIIRVREGTIAAELAHVVEQVLDLRPPQP